MARPPRQLTTFRVLAAAISATIASILPAFLTGALAVQLKSELEFSDARLGAAVALYFAGAALSSAGMGRLVERVGPGRVLRITSLIAAGILLALSQASSWTMLAGCLLLAGANNATTQPGANLLLARAIDVRRQGLAFGVKQSGMPGAALLAGIAVPALALTVGWRWAYVAAAGIALVAIAIMPTGTEHGGPAPAGPRPRQDVPLGPLAVLAVGVGLGAASAAALASFLVSAGVDVGLADGTAGLLLTGGSAVGIAVRLFVGFRADRRVGGQLPVVAVMLVGGGVAFCLFAVSGPGLFVLATPLAFGLGWAWPGLFNFAVVRTNPSAPAAATGITQTGTYLGGMLGPLCFGALADSFSFSTAWFVGAGWYVGAAVAMICGRALVRRARATGRIAGIASGS